MKKIKNICSYVFSNGLNWILFRLKYEFKKKTGYFDRQNKRIVTRVQSARNDKCLFQKNITNKSFKGDKFFIEMADNAISGKIYSFSNEYMDYSNNTKSIDWHYNPINKKNTPKDIAWNKLSDFGEYGDIKLIWEVSRFPQIYSFIHAHSVTQDTKYAHACLDQIVDWCKQNPFPNGVNYKCGQEITFRLFAWIVVIDYFQDFINAEFQKNVSENIYHSLLRIEMNIDYAAKSVKNNHSISEAAGLFVGGLLFSQFSESKRFIKKGIKYLEHELAYQVYADGSYIQHSMTYQRLVLDILSFVILIARKNSYTLPEIIAKSHEKLLNFLFSFSQENGHLPNYGNNDGANLFPCSNSSYRDFRPSLNLASLLAHNKRLFEDGAETAKLFNLNAEEIYSPPKQVKFENGGYYILKNENIFMMTRCHSYRHKPGQADMLHLDVWHKGKNIFSDTGTYSYNSPEPFTRDFAGTIGHNTIVINNCDQMEKVLNFGFCNWTKSKVIETTDTSFNGEQHAYKKDFGITHRRKINCFDKQIIIEDFFEGVKEMVNIKQSWNTDYNVETIDGRTFKVADSIITSDCIGSIKPAYISTHYNQYQEGNRIIFENNSDKDFKITTKIDFNI